MRVHGNGIQAGSSPAAVSGSIELRVWSGRAWHGVVRSGEVRLGPVRLHGDRCSKRFNSAHRVWLGNGLKVRSGLAWLGVVGYGLVG